MRNEQRHLRLVVSNESPEQECTGFTYWQDSEVNLPEYPELTDDGNVPANQAVEVILAIDAKYVSGGTEDVHGYLAGFPNSIFASRIARRLGLQHENAQFLELAQQLDPEIFQTVS